MNKQIQCVRKHLYYFQLSPCDPCIETGVAYPGNNINRVPSYDVSSLAQCQGLCRDQDRSIIL